jgi:pyrimidine operon attenuation protein/uracil phosphoribosyltransferase
MDLKLKYKELKKRVDAKTGSILFYRDDIKGLPEKVYEGDGFTVEIKNNQVYLIDIYNAEKVLKNMLKHVKTDAA